MDSAALKKRKRFTRMNLNSLKDQMSELVQKQFSIENISKLQCLVDEYKRFANQMESLIEEQATSIEEDDPNYTQNTTAWMTELKTVRDISATYEAKIRSWHRKLSTEEYRDSLLPSSRLDQSFRDTSSIQPKLEKINVPTFDGDILNFPNFKGLYENLVHNNTELSNVQKLYYLKKAFIGNAQNMIRDFELNDASYAEAWSYVLSRFNSKRLVLRSLFRKLENLASIKHESQIQTLLDQVDMIIRGLKASGEVISDSFSRFIAYHVSLRLEGNTSRDWENSVTTSDSFPTYEDLRKFLQIRLFSVEDRAPERVIDPKAKDSASKLIRKTSFSTVKLSCSLCSKNHALTGCRDFLAKTQLQRYDFAKSKGLCLNCLKVGHMVSECSSSKCRSCQGRHNTLLHRDYSSSNLTKKADSEHSNLSNNTPSSSNANPTKPSNAEVVSKTTLSIAEKGDKKLVLLPTAVVAIKLGPKRSNERRILARVLLDNASQSTLVTESFVKKYRLTAFKTRPSLVAGISGDSISSHSMVRIVVKSRVNPFEFEIEADIVARIPFLVEEKPIESIISKKRELDFAETKLPYSDVDIIIGAEYYESLMLNESIETDGVFLRNTQLGWIITGPYVLEKVIPRSYCGLTTMQIQDQLQKFWQIEEVCPSEFSNTEHDLCSQFFENTYQRRPDGRFVVKLPFKADRTTIGETRSRAIASLKRVENRLDPETRSQYIEFMKEYEILEHMSKVESATPETTYYIPHRAVLRPSSTTTKLRVVFNASAKSKTGISLNEILMVGPTIQPQLVDILIRFRNHAVAFSADISKMYRQIIIHESDRDMQRIVWRESLAEPIQDFRLNTVTYGTTPASFIATKCLEVIAKEIQSEEPTVSQVIQNDFCMDDLLSGAASVEEAAALQRVIDKALRSAGFELRKYMSNSEEFLETLHPSVIEKAKFVEFRNAEAISLLGLEWQPANDSFSVKLNTSNSLELVTKRTILSEVARIFDPLGFLSPIVIRAKIILQDVWRENKSWDDPASPNLEANFREYYNDIANLKSLEIRRRYSVLNNVVSNQLVGFCDASGKAFCAVVYLRSVDQRKNVDSYIVCAKTRVAPKDESKLTIPKLELQAALLLAELLNRVSKQLQIDSQNIFAFTDSAVALQWIRGDINKWSIFVQNRVRKIRDFVSSNQWNYVSTKLNPADLATRGLSVTSFLQKTEWFYGPQFLLSSLDPNVIPPPIEIIPEIRKTFAVCAAVSGYLDLHSLICKYSSFNKLVNVVAFLIRFVKNCKRANINRKKVEPRIDIGNIVLDVNERDVAIITLIRSSQYARYQKEIDSLTFQRSIPKTSSLYRLSLFLDENNVLRTKTRLENSNLCYDNRNPIILYSKCKLVKLIVTHTHVTNYHAGNSFIRNLLSSKYLIVGGLTNVIKFVIRSCTICIRYKAKTCTQLMGQLPKSRVTISRPFTHVGVDFAGPFNCKCTAHRSVKFYKIYAAFFICFVTRSVHIEIVSSLSAEAFIACLQRFVARRGLPTYVYSDNATNFVGADNILNIKDVSIQKFAVERSIQWRFIPPRAPHHGGIWEAAVKSGKFHLVRVTNGQTLTYEEYVTVFSNIEAILNSRPLCTKGSTSDDFQALTPAHFLIGSSLQTLAVPDSTSMKLSRRYALIQGQINSFWKVWSKSYLNQLKLRSKWNQSKTNISKGSIVIVKEDGCKPSEWPIGIVEETYPDRDGLVRVVTIRLKNSLKKRIIY